MNGATAPASFEAVIAAGLACRARGDLAGAVREFTAACEIRPNSLGSRVELAFSQLEMGALDTAEALYRAVHDQDAGNVSALAGLALVARRRGDPTASLKFLEEAAARQPEHIGVQQERALALRLLDRLDEAEAVYRQVLKDHPTAEGSWDGLAALELARGRLASAIEHARLAAALTPTHLGRRVFLAALNREAGLLADAGPLIDACLTESPENPAAWMERGMQRRLANDHPGALAAFERAAATDPPRGLIEVAAEQIALGRPDEARASYAQVLKLDPTHFQALLGLTELALLGGDYPGCLAACEPLLKAHPRRVAAHRQQARALVQLGRAEEAIRILSELEPSIEADTARLELLRTCGRREEARELVQLPRVAQSPAFPPWYETVLTHLTFHDLPAARSALARQITTRPFERSRVAYAEGMLADLEWRVDDAIACFERALALHADDPGAHHHLARLHFLGADAAGALEHLAQMNRLSGAALTLRGESTNVSQNLLGQLVNELRLDADIQAQLAASTGLEPGARAAALHELVRSAPHLTSPAIGYLLALRQAGRFTRGPAGLEAGQPQAAPAEIPRRIVQFWDQWEPPEEILRLMRTWIERHPGYAYTRFDHASAREYLAACHPPEILQAYRAARHPAQASDLFRLAYLAREGGFYADADDTCVGDLHSLRETAAQFIGYQEPFATLGNNFLGCVPGEPVIVRALSLAVESLLRGDSETLWLATGPGMMTRAFATALAAQGQAESEWLAQRRVLDRHELYRVSWPHAILPYKETRRGWVRSGFGRRIGGRDATVGRAAAG